MKLRVTFDIDVPAHTLKAGAALLMQRLREVLPEAQTIVVERGSVDRSGYYKGPELIEDEKEED